MSPDPATRILTEVRGYAELGMWHDAWEVMESLPPAARMKTPVIAMRLLLCIALARWELGSALAELIGPEHPLEDREAAGMFWLVHAVTRSAAGDAETAQRALGTLAHVWPEGRNKTLAAPSPAAVW